MDSVLIALEAVGRCMLTISRPILKLETAHEYDTSLITRTSKQTLKTVYSPHSLQESPKYDSPKCTAVVYSALGRLIS
jgi:hypothetical protein